MNLLAWCKPRLRKTWLFRKAAPLTIYARNKWFDLKHGVNTAASVPLSRVTVHGPNRNQGVIYSTVSDSMLSAILNRLPIRHELFTFVDFGAGKGKAVLIATQWPFRRVIGVEFADELIALARTNLARFRGGPRRSGEVELVHADAMEFPVPDGPLVLYFYNPFREPIMRRVIQNLRASISQQPRPVVIIYVNPEARCVLEEWTGLHLIETGPWHEIYSANLTAEYGSTA
jgi:hypothetical protein